MGVKRKGKRKQKRKATCRVKNPVKTYLEAFGGTEAEYRTHFLGCKKVKNMHSNKYVNKKMRGYCCRGCSRRLQSGKKSLATCKRRLRSVCNEMMKTKTMRCADEMEMWHNKMGQAAFTRI